MNNWQLEKSKERKETKKSVQTKDTIPKAPMIPKEIGPENLMYLKSPYTIRSHAN